jgi:hypothetical protein
MKLQEGSEYTHKTELEEGFRSTSTATLLLRLNGLAYKISAELHEGDLDAENEKR